jgi:hypothetical protein
MSVRVTIKNSKFFIESIPVCATADYLMYWVKPSKKLDLKLIPILHDYYVIRDYDEATLLLNEIKTIYNALLESTDKKAQEHAEERVKRVLLAIEDAVQNWEQVEYIDFG